MINQVGFIDFPLSAHSGGRLGPPARRAAGPRYGDRPEDAVRCQRRITGLAWHRPWRATRADVSLPLSRGWQVLEFQRLYASQRRQRSRPPLRHVWAGLDIARRSVGYESQLNAAMAILMTVATLSPVDPVRWIEALSQVCESCESDICRSASRRDGRLDGKSQQFIDDRNGL